MDFTDTVYFGSEFNEPNRILVYKIDSENIQYIQKYFPLMQFDLFGTPEDPCFIRENGTWSSKNSISRRDMLDI